MIILITCPVVFGIHPNERVLHNKKQLIFATIKSMKNLVWMICYNIHFLLSRTKNFNDGYIKK